MKTGMKAFAIATVTLMISVAGVMWTTPRLRPATENVGCTLRGVIYGHSAAMTISGPTAGADCQSFRQSGWTPSSADVGAMIECQVVRTNGETLALISWTSTVTDLDICDQLSQTG